MFKVAGISRRNGMYKVRFASDMARVKTLVKTGNDEIEMVELPKEMTKPECVTFLKKSELYQRAEFKEAIDTADIKYNGSATVKVTKPAQAEKSTKTKKSKPSLEAIKARAAQPAESETAE